MAWQSRTFSPRLSKRDGIEQRNIQFDLPFSVDTSYTDTGDFLLQELQW